ncbi:mannitol dehydrogenase family protein [Halomonas sp. MCCC 1A17488]|uniref:mannitol dehydrogenase family protein n=1 Tax=unclassified Halomonas TaxID=2609666 RepID=UPI0018D24B4C|nr:MULTISPECIES: mannitol dehydrogenase family protein [unclassified Halomonas]MCE8016079.1 mannitol dehydrogenase family protein [Halomonas sp. MCCC 1A17488]MCG3239412.1 mannitol dehydrogenase family protein [Halomonas sp. MCCC 1A17488]QPP50659.1 mannitol dehydrogenase family protein [Halomonas sp. SS10-MC5]
MPDVTRLPAAEPTGHIGIVHLGLGAFHRAHQAVYLERYRQRSGDGAWGVSSANLRGGVALVDALRDADYHYHVAEYADRDHVTLREIGVIEEALFTGRDPSGQWGRDLAALLARLASPDTRLVTLTVTEKGYFLSPAEGALLRDDPLIAHDIEHPQAPRSAPGILVEVLARRREAGIPPFTVLCCDNMPNNGQRTREAVVQLAACRDGELAAWIEREVAFPCSMVDRIVPAMTEADLARLAELGVDDPSAVVGEAFSQWVVEDDFPLGRPAWEAEGVKMVADVAPFETMKLRMLNGSHSLLAYLGALDGIETVFDAVSRDDLVALLHRYMLREAAPTLAMPAGTDLEGYAEQLLYRFANDSLRHRLQQIAMDGSQKLPQRWLHGALARLEAGGEVPCTALGVAAWIRYTAGRDLHGNVHAVDDPMAGTFALLHEAHGEDHESLVLAFLELDAVVPPALAEHAGFAAEVVSAYRCLTTLGLDAALARLDAPT